MYYLLSNPRVYNRLVKEIRDRFLGQEEITMTSTNELKYLLAVLEETFRMYPPVPSTQNRVVPGKGDTVDGRWVPGGVGIQSPERRQSLR